MSADESHGATAPEKPAPVYALAENFRIALRQLTSSVSIMTTDGAAGRAGATITSFLSVSLEPPSVLICLNGTSGVLPLLRVNRVFGVSLLSAEQQPLAEVFSNKDKDYAKRFGSGVWTSLVTGAPLLLDAYAQFDCRLAKIVEYGSHCIVIGDIVDLRNTLDPAQKALIYSNRSYCAFSAGDASGANFDPWSKLAP